MPVIDELRHDTVVNKILKTGVNWLRVVPAAVVQTMLITGSTRSRVHHERGKCREEILSQATSV